VCFRDSGGSPSGEGFMYGGYGYVIMGKESFKPERISKVKIV